MLCASTQPKLGEWLRESEGRLTKILSVGSGMVACMGLNQSWD